MVDTTTTTNDKKLGCRFNLWFVLTAFSVVVLASLTSHFKDDRNRTQQWAIAVSSVSLSLGALACLALAFVRTRFMGTPMEGGLAALCLGFWAAGLPSMMNPKTSIAIANYAQSETTPEFFYELNANVYFLSWASFLVSLLLTGSFLQEMLEGQWPERTFKRTMWWLGLGAASCVVMASGSRTFHLANCQRDFGLQSYDDSCSRVKLTVSAGAATAGLAVLMALIGHTKQLLIESVVAIAIIIMWCFGVGYITFGSKAPATNVGNLYFSVWAAFTVAAFLVADVVADFYCQMFCGEDQPKTTATKETPEPEIGVDAAKSVEEPAATEP